MLCPLSYLLLRMIEDSDINILLIEDIENIIYSAMSYIMEEINRISSKSEELNEPLSVLKIIIWVYIWYHDEKYMCLYRCEKYCIR